jgi:hypothetical protein
MQHFFAVQHFTFILTKKNNPQATAGQFLDGAAQHDY